VPSAAELRAPVGHDGPQDSGAVSSFGAGRAAPIFRTDTTGSDDPPLHRFPAGQTIRSMIHCCAPDEHRVEDQPPPVYCTRPPGPLLGAAALRALPKAPAAAAEPQAQAGSGGPQDLPIVDTHQALWDLSKLQPPWLGRAGPLSHSFLMNDYREAAKGAEHRQDRHTFGG